MFLCRYSIVKELTSISVLKSETLKVEASTKRRNFGSQFGVENSSYEFALSRQSSIANRQFIGGGEGIRTPDPRVANAVLCQLSYTPDKPV